MSDYSEEEASQYESSLNGFEQDESSQTWSDEEVVDDGTWSQEGYPNSDYGYNPGEEAREPEPPDPSCDSIRHQSWYEGETDQESHTDESHGDDSWRGDTDFQISNGEESCREETDSEFSQEEGENRPWCEIPYSDHDEDHPEETESQTNLEESEASFGDEPEREEDFAEESEDEGEAGRDDFGGDITEEEEAVSEAGRDDYGESRYINFAGHHQGPEAYLRWEQDMEDWFSSNQISEEEKTSYAEDTLTEDAFRIYERDAYIRLEYEEPDASWEEMKQILYQEFVEDVDDMRQYNLRIYTNPEPRRWILATSSKRKPTSKNACSPKPKKASAPTQKEKNESKSITGAKGETPKSNLQTVATNPREIPSLEPHGELKQCKSSKISKSKEVTCYRCHERGHFAANCPTRQIERSTILMAKSDANLVTPSVGHSNSCMIHLLLSKDVDSGHIMEHKDNEVERSKSVEKQPSETLVSGTYDLIRYWNYSTLLRCIKCSVFNDSTSSIIHLILFLSVKRKTGCIDLHHKRRETATKKSLTLDPTEKLSSRDNMLPYPKHMLCLPATKEREDVTSNFLPQEEPPDQTSSPIAFLNTRNKFTTELDQVSSSLFRFVSNNLNDVIMNLLSTEECEQSVGSLSNRVVDTLCDILCDTLYGREVDQRNLVLPTYNVVMTAITHLFLAQSVDELAGTNKEHTKHKGDSPEKKRLVHQSQNLSEPAPMLLIPPIMETRRVPNACLIKEEPPDFKIQANIQKGAKQTTPPTNSPYQSRGLILNFLLKGEPPDAPRITKPPQYQGKTLASQNRMKANLLSLGADYIVSRSKLFQERGYDADIQTKQYQDDGIIKPAAEPKLIQTGCTTPIRPDKDICLVFEAYQVNHGDSMDETTWRLFTAQLQNTSKKNQPKRSSDEGFIQVTSWVIPGIPDLDILGLFGDFRSNEDDLCYKPTCSRILTHRRHAANWIHANTSSGVKVIDFLNQRILRLPYLEPFKFGRPQSLVWRPGETLIHLETSRYIILCTSTHRVRRIFLHLEFPYFDAFTLGAIKEFAQQFSPSGLGCVLETFYTFQRLPRTPGFMPKLTRYKAPQDLPYLSRFSHLKTNDSFS